MKPLDTIDLHFVLQRKQRAFVESTVPFNMYVGGVGAGKTYAGAVRTIIYMATHPNSFGAIYAPTYNMLRDATQRTLLQLLPKQLIVSFNKNEQRLILFNGAECIFRSTDNPDSLRGTSYAWYWMDEAPYCGYYAWELLKARLRQKGFMPTAWATGTPKGKDGFYRAFEAPTTRIHGHQLFRASTRDNAANLPFGYIESLNYQGQFYEQEVEGLFTAFNGLVYSLENDPDVVTTHIKSVPPSVRFTAMIGGIDWGYTNPAVAIVIGIDEQGVAWQLCEWYRKGCQLERDFIPVLLDLTTLFGVTDWYCDPAYPANIATLSDALDSHMLATTAQRAVNDIVPGIQTVQGLLAMRPDGSRGYFIDPSCIHTIEEFGSYQYLTTSSALRNPDEKPIKQNDHCLDALRYVLHAYYRDATLRSIPIAVSHGQRELPADTPIPARLHDPFADNESQAHRISTRRTQIARVLRDPFLTG